MSVRNLTASPNALERFPSSFSTWEDRCPKPLSRATTCSFSLFLREAHWLGTRDEMDIRASKKIVLWEKTSFRVLCLSMLGVEVSARQKVSLLYHPLASSLLFNQILAVLVKKVL